jgi:tellurite resistance protein TehA-like permease
VWTSVANSATALLDAVPPSGGAAVMGTGIVSVGLALDHHATLSGILFGIAAALWFGFVAAALRGRARWHEVARRPTVLTAVAATAVVGARLVLLRAGWAGYLLLALACALWLVLVPAVLRSWRTPTVGASFVLTVATESLAALAGLLAFHDRVGWLAVAALVPLALGLAAYGFVLARVDLRQLLTGRGDQWVFGGALAIAALACAPTASALAATSTLPGLRSPLDDTAVVLWAAAALWLPALLVGELVAPRLRYDSHRWSTVFPLGMYAACSLTTGRAIGADGIAELGRIWVWVALAAWLLVFAGMLGRARRSIGT